MQLPIVPIWRNMVRWRTIFFLNFRWQHDWANQYIARIRQCLWTRTIIYFFVSECALFVFCVMGFTVCLRINQCLIHTNTHIRMENMKFHCAAPHTHTITHHRTPSYVSGTKCSFQVGPIDVHTCNVRTLLRCRKPLLSTVCVRALGSACLRVSPMSLPFLLLLLLPEYQWFGVYHGPTVSPSADSDICGI